MTHATLTVLSAGAPKTARKKIYCAVLPLLGTMTFSASLKAAELPQVCTVSGHNAAHFRPIAPARTSGLPVPAGDAVRLTADRVKGEGQKQVQAAGNVIIERADAVFNTESADYSQEKDEISGSGSFVLSNSAADITGENLRYRPGTEEGSAQTARFAHRQKNRRYQGEAAALFMAGNRFYRLKDVRLNTCLPGDDSWYIQAASIDADNVKNIGVARHAKLYFKSVPVLYMPWMDFPLNGARKSGFLAPTLGGGSDGFTMSLPYYFNLAANRDATLIPQIYSRRGFLLGGEYRYLNEDYQGKLWGQWMPDDSLSDRDNRYVFHFRHRHRITPKITATIDYHQASDDDYYRDLGNRLNSIENVNLNRELRFDYNDTLWGGNWRSFLKFQQYQLLKDEKNLLDEPYRLLPRLQGEWNKRIGKDGGISVLAQFSHFEHSSKQNGYRTVLYPSASWHFYNQWGFIRPKIGLHATDYHLSQNNTSRSNGHLSRVLPIASVDGGMTFERSFRFQNTPFVQTLEPRLFYTYIPAKAQNHLPNFDSSENSFSYDQLFRENRFSGQDRINAANQISVALSSRFYRQDDGTERLRAGIGQRFYLHGDDVDLSGSLKERRTRRSDFIAFAGGNIREDLSVQGDWHYNYSDKNTQSFSGSLNYHPQDHKIFSLRVGFDRDYLRYYGQSGELKYIDAGLQWPLYKQYYLLARQSYSLTDKKPLDQLIGIKFRSECRCWGANLVYQRYVTDYNRTKNAVFFQIHLNGLGGVGNNPDEELRRAIPGYYSFNKENM